MLNIQIPFECTAYVHSVIFRRKWTFSKIYWKHWFSSQLIPVQIPHLFESRIFNKIPGSDLSKIISQKRIEIKKKFESIRLVDRRSFGEHLVSSTNCCHQSISVQHHFTGITPAAHAQLCLREYEWVHCTQFFVSTIAHRQSKNIRIWLCQKVSRDRKHRKYISGIGSSYRGNTHQRQRWQRQRLMKEKVWWSCNRTRIGHFSYELILPFVICTLVCIFIIE